MRVLNLSCFGSILLLLGGLVPVYGQSSFSITPSPMFVNVNVNDAPVQLGASIASSNGSSLATLVLPTAPWLSSSVLNTPVPANFTITVNPAGLAAGVYSTNLQFSDSSGAVTGVPVIMTVNTPGTPLSSTPNNLTFGFAPGGSTPQAQSLSVGSTTPVSYSVSASTNWITVNTSTGQAAPGTPGSVSLSVDPTKVNGPGTYVGSVTITPSGGVALVVPIILQYTSTPQFTSSVSPLLINVPFSLQVTSAQATVAVGSTGGPISFNATANVISGGPAGSQWLSVSPQTGTTPATLTATVNTIDLPTGQYQASIDLTATDGSGATMSIPVTLNFSQPTDMSVSPTALSFSYNVGAPAPAHQAVTPTTTIPGQSYTVAVASNGNGTWLKANGGGTTPNPIDVSVDPTGLPAGNYAGTVTVTIPGANGSPQTVNVSLAVSNSPTLTSPSATPGITFNYEIGFGVPAPRQVSVSSVQGDAVAFVIGTQQNNTSNNVTWLLAGTPSSTVTPATFSVGISPQGLAPGKYTGVILATAAGGNPLSIPVALNVTSLGSPLAAVNPTALTFNVAPGGSANPQTVTVTSTGETLAYGVSGAVTTPSGGTWLVVSNPLGPAALGSSSSFFASVISNGLAPGTYTGSVTVTPTNGNPAVTIPVTLNVAAASITVSPATLSFVQSFNGAAPAAQTINVGSSATPLSFTAGVIGGSWLNVTPTTGTTPASVTVSVNGVGLQPGNYTAQVVLTGTGPGSGQQIVTVNLTVVGSQTLAASPTALAFSSVAGSAPPPPQTVALTASSASLPFNATVSVSSPLFGAWLAATPTSGTATTTPATLTISVNPQGLAPGVYNGVVMITSPGLPGVTQTINVAYFVSAQ